MHPTTITPIYWHVLGTSSAYPEYEGNDEAMHLVEMEGEPNCLAVNMCTTVTRILPRMGKSLANVGTLFVDHWEHNDQGYAHPLAHKMHFNPNYKGDGGKSPHPLCKNQARPRLIVAGRDTEDLWNKELIGLNRVQAAHLDMHDYFGTEQVKDGGTWKWKGLVEFTTIRVTHADGDQRKGTYPIYSRGISFVIKGVKYYFTGDYNLTDLDEVVIPEMKKADVILSDCETTPFATGVHPNIKDLTERLGREVREKILFYSMNHQPGSTTNMGAAVPNAKDLGFGGYLRPMDRLELGNAEQNLGLGHRF